VAEASFSDFQNYWLDLFLIFRNNWLHPATPAFAGARRTAMQYFVVMIDYGRRGREATTDTLLGLDDAPGLFAGTDTHESVAVPVASEPESSEGTTPPK